MNIASVYLPKGPNDFNTEWLKSLQDQQPGKWVISGDFNAHSPFWENNCSIVTSNRLVENIVDSSFYLLNDGSVTRIPDVSKHRATAIDLTLVSPELVPSCSWETHRDSLGSDHVPIIITMAEKDKYRVNNKDEVVPKYNYKKANWGLFQNILSTQDFEKAKNENVDTMYSNFTGCVLSAANLSIPKIKKTGSQVIDQVMFGGQAPVKKLLSSNNKHLRSTLKIKRQKTIPK